MRPKGYEGGINRPIDNKTFQCFLQFLDESQACKKRW